MDRMTSGGSLVEGFHSLEVLHRGAAATVYRAVPDGGGDPVVLKVARTAGAAPERARVPEDVPGAVRVLAAGSTRSGRPFVAMPLYGDGDYAGVLDRRHPLPLPEVARVGAVVAGALEALHAAGLAHHAVEPSHVLLGGGEVALTGLDRVLPLRTPGPAPDVAALPHTPPEAVDGRAATPASDVYRLAATLWTLLAGRPPFADGPADLFSLRERVLAEVLPPPRADLPGAWWSVLSRGLAKDPALRHPDAAAFAAALRAATPGAVPTPPAPPVPEAPPATPATPVAPAEPAHPAMPAPPVTPGAPPASLASAAPTTEGQPAEAAATPGTPVPPATHVTPVKEDPSEVEATHAEAASAPNPASAPPGAPAVPAEKTVPLTEAAASDVTPAMPAAPVTPGVSVASAAPTTEDPPAEEAAVPDTAPAMPVTPGAPAASVEQAMPAGTAAPVSPTASAGEVPGVPPVVEAPGEAPPAAAEPPVGPGPRTDPAPPPVEPPAPARPTTIPATPIPRPPAPGTPSQTRSGAVEPTATAPLPAKTDPVPRDPWHGIVDQTPSTPPVVARQAPPPPGGQPSGGAPRDPWHGLLEPGTPGAGPRPEPDEGAPRWGALRIVVAAASVLVIVLGVATFLNPGPVAAVLGAVGLMSREETPPPGAELPEASEVPGAAIDPESAPADVALEDSGEAVVLTWTAAPGAESAPHHVVGGPAGDTPASLADAVAGTAEARVEGLDPETEYCFIVIAVLGADTIAHSEEVCTERGAG
ncbi:hypothetical protein ACOQFV_04805 [Nocardiopsis changdeensis]|uniref:non-specific serine/threonine protein kinase n=1 Tax=Nocardiopsis changdeensis TaxID=2831969 RepID=A0ABX8BQT8_9ACTN|nr:MULTISPECIES: hypothetical protein [Nocardiopsis]QUX23211.1 hypothetical protein KGD84_02060 [Nocardiopsis changdeensis]QYX39153.1 hypothetical protein K1J57_11510 [Nocardiopsis sp. MT53]